MENDRPQFHFLPCCWEETRLCKKKEGQTEAHSQQISLTSSSVFGSKFLFGFALVLLEKIIQI